MSSTIGEPFQLFLGSAHSQRTHLHHALYATHNHDGPGYATVTAQSDGIHVWDLQNLHPVASYSVGKHVIFTTPAFSLYVSENGNKFVISYAALDVSAKKQSHTIWIIRQSLSGSGSTSGEKSESVVDVPPVRICGTGHDTIPLLLVSKNGGISIANAQVDIKSQLQWEGDRKHLNTFVFPRKSCSFIQDSTPPCSSVAIICCKTHKTLQVRLVLLGEEIVALGTCEIPIPNSNYPKNPVHGVTCSPSGILSFVDPHAVWVTHQLMLANSSLVSAPISENLCLRRSAFLNSEKRSKRDGFAVVSLGTSLVLLAAFSEETEEFFFQIWDLSYGVILATQSMPLPSSLSRPHLSLTMADEGQVLLTVSSSQVSDEMHPPKRPSIYIVPVDTRLKSSLAGALGKTALTTEWLDPKTHSQKSEDDGSAEIISTVRSFLETKNSAQRAEQAFLKWVDSHSSRESVLGHEFVKKIFNLIFPPEPPANYPYTPRITRCILENAVVSTILLNGRLITTLRQRGDWENVMFALTKVTDISEDELMATAKSLIDRQRRSENAMDVDASEGHAPPLWSYLFACVSYPFSVPPLRLAIRKHIPDAQDLVMILEILEIWIQGGDEHEVAELLRSFATPTESSASRVDAPPYPKVIAFLQALLDASFVALLQYQPSYDVLTRILSCIEPEIAFLEGMESLRGVLEPFAKVQMIKERSGPKESPTEWKKRRRQLEQRAELGIGLYRLEELVI